MKFKLNASYDNAVKKEKAMRPFWYSIIRPISQRLATAAGAALTGIGMAASDVSIVVAAIPVVAGFAADLIIRQLY